MKIKISPLNFSSQISSTNKSLSNEYHQIVLNLKIQMTDAQELSLVTRVELRIALADTEAKLQDSLELYLCPLLLKLASPHSSVRHQVIKFIHDTIPRINSSATLKLPVLKLVNQAKSPSLPSGVTDGTTVQLYSLLFASKGIDKLDLIEKRKLIPEIIRDIHTFPSNVSARLFHILTKLLKDWQTPDRASDEFVKLREELNIPVADEIYIADKFEKLLLLMQSVNPARAAFSCPGLSPSDVKFLTTDAGVSYHQKRDLALVNISVSSFIPLLHDENIITYLLIASVGSNDKVANSALALLRKITIPYENETLISHLISLFIGETDSQRLPVNAVIQEKFFSVLNNSVIATKSPLVPTLTSIGLGYGYQKRKSATIRFIQWVAKNGNDFASSEAHFTNVATQLRNNLHDEGWPRFPVGRGVNYASEVLHRRLQYEALGQILKKNPRLVLDLSFIEFLFDSLLGDIEEVRSTIQEALGSLVVHLPLLNDAARLKLKLILKNYLQNEDFARGESDAIQAVRFTSLKYLNTAFPFSDPEARILNVLGSSTKNRSDVIEEAQKGLHPYWFSILQSQNTSDFLSTSELLGTGKTLEFPSFSSYIESLKEYIDYAKVRDTASLRYSLRAAVKFGLRIIVTQAIKGEPTVIVQDQEWSTRLEKGLEHDETVISLTKKQLAREVDLNYFLSILLNETSQDAADVSISHTDDPIYGSTLLKLVSLAPQDVIAELVPEILKLTSVISSDRVLKNVYIQNAANLIGIIGSHPSNSPIVVKAFYGDLVSSLKIAGPNSQQYRGALLTLGYVSSRLLLRGEEEFVGLSLFESYYEALVNALQCSDASSYEAAVISVTELAKFGGFGPALSSEKIQTLKYEILEVLKLKVKKVDDRSMIAVALLSLSEEEIVNDVFTDYESTIYDSNNTKQVESLFTSGEAFSILASGWDSKFLKQKIDIQDEHLNIRVFSRNVRADFILKKILEAASSSKPALRKAGCIWLLSLVQYSGGSPYIINNSNLIHLTFMRFLADREELIQESASRGLSLIYDLGDPDLKETLVKSLLKSFTDSTASTRLTAGSINHDTELFEPGVLKTDDGSVSTYKDILSLASEIGDPSLVYKFMSLAKSSALWSSRKGIAFGLGSIMSKSSLDKLLFENESLSNRLIPKLYRYRFDPNPSVARSMTDIWTTIVQDSSKTIDKYYNEILKELLMGMSNKEWRVREASTVALTDLLQTVTVDKYKDNLEEIWTMGFRAIDDIKESVRKAGSGLTKSLSQTLVNSINVESGASETRAQDVLTKLLPFLLGNKGILSDAEDVRNFALSTVLKLIKKAGKAIKPFIAELIDQFVLLMSTLEPQIINYLALNADKYKLKHDDIDAKRIQSIGSSPMMNALEKLVDLIDDQSIEEVISRLQSTIKKSVGLPSKAAASRIIVTLIIRHLNLIEPYSDTLLNICVSQLKDRNNTVSSSFATAAGYVCRVASIASVTKYAAKLQGYYFESEDEQTRIVAGVASEAVSKYSGDRFASVSTAFLPVAYIAQNDEVKEVSQPFKNEWSENTSGNGAVKLYIEEICDLVKQNINSQQFSIRQTAARSIAKACNSLEGSAGLSKKVSDELFDVLIAASQGRSWSGKEDVLAALVSLSIKSESYLTENIDVLAKVNKTVITEAKRRNKTYQKHAVISLGVFLNKFPNQETYDEEIEIFEAILGEEYYDSEDEDEEERTKTPDTVNVKATKKNLTREADRMSALASLTTSFQIYENGDYHSDLLEFIVKALVSTFESKVYIPTWRSQVSVADGIAKIAKVLVKANSLHDTTIKLLKDAFLVILRNNTSEENVENVRVQTVRAGKALCSIGNAELSEFIKSKLIDYKNREKSSVVKVEIENAITI